MDGTTTAWRSEPAGPPAETTGEPCRAGRPPASGAAAALPADWRDVPAVHGDLDGARAGHEVRRDRATADDGRPGTPAAPTRRSSGRRGPQRGDRVDPRVRRRAAAGRGATVPRSAASCSAARESFMCASRARRSHPRTASACSGRAGVTSRRLPRCSRPRARAEHPRRRDRGRRRVLGHGPSGRRARAARRSRTATRSKNAVTWLTPAARGSAPAAGRPEYVVVAAHVQAERRLAVGRGRDHPHVAGRLAGHWVVDEPADVGGALVPAGERRHLPDRVAR